MQTQPHPKHLAVRTTTLRLWFAMMLMAWSLSTFASPSNKWRVEVSGSAKVAGEIEFSVTPKNTAPDTVVVQVPVRTSENRVAQLIRDAFVAKFGKAVYHVEVDDGEDVLVKAKRSTPHFDLVLVRNTANGIRLNVGKE